MRKPTPYDTGKRLEPVPWVKGPSIEGYLPSNFGKVDFDDEESATVATLWMERNEDGSYTLHGFTTVELKIEIKEE